ncbi:hypothetical protein L6452_18514 [Arctium lappa]|uniref:Uncharacterized protein n=1 Tax=Arctium lappa TaxID=4217 RepID=A0ACB9C6P4_ARCLA|nr:hypothetical protein L6452_18514 [Arctium lappa]
MIVVKRIFRYLKGTPNLGLWYPKDSGFDLTGYSDSDFAGCKLDRKSTTGGCQLLGGKLVSWTSKKQNSVSTCTAEAEYVAAGSCCAQLADLFTKPLDETRFNFLISELEDLLIATKNVKFNISESEIPMNNHLARLDFEADKYPYLMEVVAFLKQSCLAYALNVDPKPSKTLLQQFWFTADEATITNKKGDVVPAISFTIELGSGMLTAYGLRKALRLPEKTKAGFDALSTDAELIQFLDDMEYCWDNKPRSTIPNKRLT